MSDATKSKRVKRAKKPRTEKPLDIEVHIEYYDRADHPDWAAAYDAMWRRLILGALDRLDAKATQRSDEHERSDTSAQTNETSPHEEG